MFNNMLNTKREDGQATETKEREAISDNRPAIYSGRTEEL